MVVSMIKWRPWPPLHQSVKFEAKIVVRSLTGLSETSGCDDGLSKLMVEIKWKGLRANGFRSFRKKSVKRDCTREENLGQNGVVWWDEEFRSVCGFCGSKDKAEGLFNPWEVSFLVCHGSRKRSRKKVPLAAPTVLNLAEFASLGDLNELEIIVPLSINRRCFKCSLSLCISLSLTKLRTTQELPEEVQRPIMFAPLSPCFGRSLPKNEDEGSSLKPNPIKVKSLTDYVLSRREPKAFPGEGNSDSKFSTGSEDSESNYPFDSDSFDDSDEGESEESKEHNDVQKSCNYGTLVHANLAGGALDFRINCEDEDLLYYSKSKPDVESSPAQDFGTEVSEQGLRLSPKFGILAWRKRNLSLRSPKVKGEPLLKKDYGEDGGDDIDFDRRQLSSDESMGKFEGSTRSGTLISEFGDDNFAVGSWEQKEVLSRDGSLKLRTQVFFASIDQRNERAAGESACTALVAVIADWLHSNQGVMPTKSEFDSLIREGSLQWRNLCYNDVYRERFPDKHFDLDTVIESKIRPLSAVPERSFIGFFYPEGLEEECFGFLHGAMSFDNIWEEICQVASGRDYNDEPLVYVVSWNDHFFLLRVDTDAYYLIDTLGERLYEGCNQAYVLKFDQDTTIERIPTQSSPNKDEKPNNGKLTAMEASPDRVLESVNPSGSEVAVCRGKESCKEYIKSFLAAIPVRELQVDMKKGSSASTLVHQRLQIEFNLTAQVLPTPAECTGPEMVADELLQPAVDELAPMEAEEMTTMAAGLPVPMVALAAA